MLTCTSYLDVKPERYPSGSTLEDIARLEKEAVRDDPSLFLECCSEIEVTAEYVEEV